MIQTDYLLTFAEIGVALAGFSSLVALLGTRGGAGAPHIDAVRLQVMLEASLFVALMSVLPLIPHAFGASLDTTWRISALGFLATDGLASYVAARRWRSVASQFTSQDRAIAPVVGLLSFGADFLILPVLLGFLLAHAAALYLSALLANLVLAGLVFIRFASATFLGSARR